VGADRKHLKLALHQSDRVFDAIGFNLGERLPEISRTVDLAYRLERNEFRGVVSLQLVVQDLKPV
jgi:single-stranded-DNA-specific exonuclease